MGGATPPSDFSPRSSIGEHPPDKHRLCYHRVVKKKRCTGCRKLLPLSAFSKKRDGLNTRCKKCCAHYYKHIYKANPKRRQQIVEAVARRRKKIVEFIRNLKDGKPCADCGKPYPYYVMDFDHVRGKKVVELSRLATRKGWSEKKILVEAKKCDIVCANCHRLRTHKRNPP